MLITNIENGLIGDAAGTRFEGALRIKDGLIAEMGALTPQAGETVIDARGCVVTPGLVNTHHHLFQSLLKGLALDLALDDWLMAVPFTWWPHFCADTLAIAARVGLAELALSGATTVCDHHYVFSDRYDFDPAEVLFSEAGRMGLRFVLARGGMTKGRAFTDPALPPSPAETLTQFIDGIIAAADRWHDPSDLAMTRVACAPATPTFNVEPDELPQIAQAMRARGLRLHSHLSENRGYVDFTQARFGQRPVPWLADKGWLGPDVWYAHLVELDAAEVAILAETGTAMAHCVQANARLGSGIAPADALHAAGGVVSIGVDGAAANEAADMGAALYATFATHRATKGVGATRAETVLHWASAGGARALGLARCGTLAPGMAADIAIFDISAPRNMGLHDPALAPILTGAAAVRHSFVGGRPLVIDGRLPGLDLADLAEDARSARARLAARRATALSRLG